MTVDALTRTFHAELRGVEEGHHARREADDDPTVYRVVSDVRPDEWRYRVHVAPAYLAHGAIAAPEFQCDHLLVQTISIASVRSESPGLTPCKHAARVARRLEREGLIRWHEVYGWIEADGAKLLTALRPPPRRSVSDADLFDNL